MHAGSISYDGNVFSIASRSAVRVSVSSRALFVLVTRMVDGVKIVDFSNTVLLSRSRYADHGALRGSASFGPAHENEWSKVSWLLDQINSYRGW